MASKANGNQRAAAKAKAATVVRSSAAAKKSGAVTPRTRPPLSGPDRKPNRPKNTSQGKPKNPKNTNTGGSQEQSAQSSQSNSSTQSGSAASPTRMNYSFGSVAGNIYDQSMGNLIDYGNKYGDNDLVSGAVHGTIIDSLGTGIRMGQAAQYNDMFLNSLGNYQGGMENLRTGNTMKLMGAEAGLARDLIGVQGREARSLRETEGAQERLNIAERGSQDRMGFRVQGEEDRKKLQEEGTQQLRLRADARGAIRAQGSRFFG